VSLSAADPPAADVRNVRNGQDVRRLAGHPPMSARTRATYAERAGRFLGWLDAGGAASV
jgi:hypothetical protein